MAPKASTEAPQQHKQPSRKGKKAWRKHVDVSDVQDGLEEAREEVIKGGIVAEKASDDLFALDTAGSQAIQKAYNKTQRPLKSDEILAQRSPVPSIDTHKRSLGVTDGVIEPSNKRRNTDGVSPKEYARLRQVAYGPQSVQEIIKNGEDPPGQDLWTMDPGETEQDPRFDYLDKPKPIRAPGTLRETPISLVAGIQEVPAVSKPKPGTSYNPVFQEWDALLTSEGAKEVKAEKKRLALVQAEKEFAERVAAADKEAELEAALQTEDESAWEGFESDYDQVDVLGKKRPERKTPQERRKVERRKERERQEQGEKKEKEREKRERRIGELKAELDKAEKLRSKLAVVKSNNVRPAIEQKSELATTGTDEAVIKRIRDVPDIDETALRRRRFGKDAIPERPLELVLPDELQDSLRSLKPEGNLLADRYRNMLIRGKLETRKAVQQPKKKQRKVTEKWTYKDFEVPV